jgi:penicillin amidase
LEPSTLSRSLLLLDKAQNWTQFREALSYWDIPSQNFVFADLNGNIGYQMPGRIPYRAADHEGIVPVDGSVSDYEWRGYVPFDSLPRIYNPERQFIVTANQAVVPPEFYDTLAESLGGDVNARFSFDWSYGYRGQRINDLMRQLAPLSVDDYRQIHGDNHNIGAVEIMPYIEALTFTDGGLSDARDWLMEWDFVNDMDSPHAALFAVFTARLLENVFDDQLPEAVEAGGHQVWSLFEIMDEPENPWWDDTRTTGNVETRDDMLLRSFREAVERTTSLLGENRDQWRWGSLHTATFVTNPLGLSGIDLIENMVNRGPVETGGGFEIVNATGWSGQDDDYTVSSLPSMRMILDLSNFDNSLSIHTTGQSGHPFSEHYGDMIELWRNIDYHPMPFTRDAVEAASQTRLVLSPQG